MKLDYIKIKNFKGCIEFEMHPQDGETTIYGKNRAGKSTIADAFYWVLFGKNQSGSADFGIKNYLRKDLNKRDHFVEVMFDGAHKFTKIYKESWVRKTGEKEGVYSGNTTEYYLNDVPVTMALYNAKIEEILPKCKLLASANYFTEVLKWEDRRMILLEIVKPYTDAQICESNKELNKLHDLIHNKSIYDLKKEVSTKISKINDEIEELIIRIDELTSQIPDEVKEDDINSALGEIDKEIDQLQGEISRSSKHDEERQNKASTAFKKIKDLEQELHAYCNAERSSMTEVQNDSVLLLTKINRLISAENIERAIAIDKLKKLEYKLLEKNSEIESLRSRWSIENSREFINELQDSCLVCKRPFDISELQAKSKGQEDEFNSNKAINLKEINKQGAALKAEIHEFLGQKESLEKMLSEIDARILELESQKPKKQPKSSLEIDQEICATEKYSEIIELIKSAKDDYQNLLNNQNKETIISDIQSKYKDLQSKRDELIKSVNTNTVIQLKDRICSLNEQHINLGQELSTNKEIAFLIKRLTEIKIQLVESKLNEFFGLEFKMFDQQINGGTREICTIMLDGVEYPDLNTEGKMTANLLIVKGLQEHYGVTYPIFLDNRESVTDIPKMNAQIINLFVDPTAKKLKVV
jgi:DNA repair exonuclease SbcCD ATPase subunit